MDIHQWSDAHKSVYAAFKRVLPEDKALINLYNTVRSGYPAHDELTGLYQEYGLKAIHALGSNASSTLLDYLISPMAHAVDYKWHEKETLAQHAIDRIAMVMSAFHFEQNPTPFSAEALLTRLTNILEKPLEGTEIEPWIEGQQEHYEDLYHFPQANVCLKLLLKHLEFGNIKPALSEIFQGRYNQRLDKSRNDYDRPEDTNRALIGSEVGAFTQYLKSLHREGGFSYAFFKNAISLYTDYFNPSWHYYPLTAGYESTQADDEGLLLTYAEYSARLLRELAGGLPESADLMYELVNYIYLTGIEWMQLGLDAIVRNKLSANAIKYRSSPLGRSIQTLVCSYGLPDTETDDQLVRMLRNYKERELLLILPYAGYARDSILKALEWDDLLPLQKQLFSNAGDHPGTTESIVDIANCASEDSGVIDRAKLAKIVANIDKKRAAKYLKAFRSSTLEISGHLMLVDAVMDVNRDKIEQKLARHAQTPIKAYGLYPVKSETDLRERYIKFKTMHKEATRYGSERQENTQAAVRAGLKNLAQSAGYADEIRLEWSMEADIAANTLPLDQLFDIDAWQIGMTLEGITPRIGVYKDHKQLKSVPPKVRQSALYKELRSSQEQIQRQASRFRHTLEEMMCNGDEISTGELATLSRLPVVSAMLSQLILKTEDDFGLFNGSTDTLTAHDGSSIPLQRNPTIAHVYHLFKAGILPQWQQTVVQQRIVQPFKQAFRELYLLTPAEIEAKTRSTRFRGHVVDGATASRLFQSRRWSQENGDRVEVYKYFPRHDCHAEIGFPDAGHYLSETPSVTVDEIRFQRDRKPLDLESVDPLVFSEVMRDIDLVTAVAQIDDKDHRWSTETATRRAELVFSLIQALKLKQVSCEGHYAYIEGKLAKYRIHLGSGVIHIQPGNYLCIVPQSDKSVSKDQNLYLPFADTDRRMAEIISKIFLLIRDDKITDKSILVQIRNSTPDASM